MAKGFSKLSLAPAVRKHSKMDLSSVSLLTQNIGEILPLHTLECIPGDKIPVKVQLFSRMMPLVVPSYVKASYNVMSAFVPYHQLVQSADAWLTGDRYYAGRAPKIAFYTMGDMFTTFSYCMTTGTAEEFDVSYINSAGTTVYLRYGHGSVDQYRTMKTLMSLGYRCPIGVDLRTGSNWNTVAKNIKVSAMPLLALAKVYYDHMSQSTLYQVNVLGKILNGIYSEDTNYIKQDGSLVCSFGASYDCSPRFVVNQIVQKQPSDYFTTAWQASEAPIAGTEYASNIGSMSNQIGSLNTIFEEGPSNDGVATSLAAGKYSTTLSQVALNGLDAFYRFVKRNNYTGGRAVERILARFGIKPSSLVHNVSDVVMPCQKFPIQIGDVTSTSANEADNLFLGSYAGKGIISDGNGFEYSCSDFGILITLGWISIVPMNYLGWNTHLLKNTPLQHYNPEFDGVGTQPISVSEFTNTPGSNETVSSVFGWTDRYNEYRFANDTVIGDYIAFEDMKAWFCGRDRNSAKAQQSGVVNVPIVENPYNRIFVDTNSDVDHFYISSIFDIKATRPMTGLNNSMGDLAEGDISVQRNGEQIS
ncbi:major capsid protein [Capybara microvirus Cap1_SP_99]|nr:major capsid protein [Capybara microvirus Cap1_SP_99]